MAVSLVMTTTASEFLQGSHRQKLLFHNHSPSKRCCLLWGTLCSQNWTSGVFNRERISLRCSSSKNKPRVVVLGSASTSLTEESKPRDEVCSEHVIHFYRIPLIQESATSEFLKLVQTEISSQIVGVRTEQCFNIGLDSELSSEKLSVLKQLLQETCEPVNLETESFLAKEENGGSYRVIVEVGPRLSVATAWSAYATSICQACGLVEVTRLERSRRYLLYVRAGSGALQDSQIDEFAAMVHDRMTECVYIQKWPSFKTGVVRSAPVMDMGCRVLETINEKMGLAFYEQDILYNSRPCMDEIKRNPTTGGLFDITWSNSEHNRHRSTLQANPCNSVFRFMDNSSAIPVKQLRSVQSGSECPLDTAARGLDILFTADTQNFPCAVAPYPTGASGRTMHTHATRWGSFFSAPTAGCCFGNLDIKRSYAPWEDLSFPYPSNLAPPLQILKCATSGSEGEPNIGMLVVKIGSAYYEGMRGEAASSMVTLQNDAEVDFNAVQRGDAEMAQKLYHVVRACIEMGENNPIISIHDQGAGGNCNVIKEIIYPKGAEIDIGAIVVGDHKLSVLEIQGAEYEKQAAILVKPESRCALQSICERERVSMAVIGIISGEGRAVLVDGLPSPLAPAVDDLELEKVFAGDIHQECLDFHGLVHAQEPLDSARGMAVMAVPKKRTSKSKTRIRKNFWMRKAKRSALYAFSLAKSIATGKSKSFLLSK